jgi:NADH-quinone oxidoreductase subunit A
MLDGQAENLWALGLYFLVVLLIVASMLGLSYVLGQRHKEPATGSPYESGMVLQMVRWPAGERCMRLQSLPP